MLKQKYKKILRILSRNILATLLHKIEVSHSELFFSGYIIKLPFRKLQEHELNIVKFREENICLSFKVDLPAPIINYLLFIIPFSIKVDTKSFNNNTGYFNLLLKNNTTGDRTLTLKSGSDKLSVKDHLFYISNLKNNTYDLFVPYFDDIVNFWRLDIYRLSHSEKNELDATLALDKIQNRDKQIWFIGEYNNSARDNGMHFYNYLRKNKPEIEAYYIIEDGCPEIVNIIDKKNILYYGTFKHLMLSQKVSTLVFSHMPNYLLPKINQLSAYKNNYKSYRTIFLQHGVIATTTSVSPFRKELRHYSKFIVSSEKEKNIVNKFLGYSSSEVAITGLARWDKLQQSKQECQNILIMPTWRNDLEKASESEFLASDYYKYWNSLLQDIKLQKLLIAHNLKINFYIHNIFKRFLHLFYSNDNIILANEIHIQELLISNCLMITDYSSISFDFLYLKKPVLYYTFDLKSLQKVRSGKQYINYENELPGPISFTLDQVIKEIEAHIKNDFCMQKKYSLRLKQFFTYLDDQNCDRIYQTIKELK